MKATINDVARHAGVSKATVSRVLNGYSNVAAHLRERVKQSIETLDYRPSAVARDLSIGQTKLLGVLLEDNTQAFCAQWLRGLEDRASENGYLLLVRNTDANGDREEQSILRLVGQNVAGIALLAASASEESKKALHNANVPAVYCCSSENSTASDHIYFDEANMAQVAVNHLMALGHRSIALFYDENDVGSQARVEGYALAMEKSSLAPFLIASGDTFEQSFAALCGKLLGQTRPSALICADEARAFVAFDALLRMGIRLPEELSLIALGIADRQATGSGFLTAVTCPAYEIGAAAADMLLERIGGFRRKPEQRTLPCALRMRHSCAEAAPSIVISQGKTESSPRLQQINPA